MKSLALQVGIAEQYMYVLGWWSDVNDLSHLSHSYPLITYEVSCEYLNLILKIEAILLIWNFKRVTSLVLVIMQPKVCINIHHCNISYHDISCTDCPIPSTCSHHIMTYHVPTAPSRAHVHIISWHIMYRLPHPEHMFTHGCFSFEWIVLLIQHYMSLYNPFRKKYPGGSHGLVDGWSTRISSLHTSSSSNSLVLNKQA
jgi:hypothetical protein